MIVTKKILEMIDPQVLANERDIQFIFSEIGAGKTVNALLKSVLLGIEANTVEWDVMIIVAGSDQASTMRKTLRELLENILLAKDVKIQSTPSWQGKICGKSFVFRIYHNQSITGKKPDMVIIDTSDQLGSATLRSVLGFSSFSNNKIIFCGDSIKLKKDE